MVINKTKRDGRMTNQVRYHILSRKMKAKEFGQAVRGHWGIENQLHWQLDVSYQGTSAVSVKEMRMPTWPSLGGSP